MAKIKTEIERRFFVRELPDLSKIMPVRQEVYFVKSASEKQGRVTVANNIVRYEEKIEISSLERTTENKVISVAEAQKLLKDNHYEMILREKYFFSVNPSIIIQVYHGRFDGFIRADVAFDSMAEAKEYTPLDWMSKEITGLPIARDFSLMELSDAELDKYSAELKK